MENIPDSVTVGETETTEVQAPEVTAVTPEPTETIEVLEALAEKTDDVVPLKKYMTEKNGKRDAEARATALEAELTQLRSQPRTEQTSVDVKAIATKHDIDEQVLHDILDASYTMTKERVRQELEAELSPKLEEFETIKREKERENFNAKFDTLLAKTLAESPEYKDLVDPTDLKKWIKSGEYSKLNLPQLVELKYGKFVQGKRTIEQAHPSKDAEPPKETSEWTVEDWQKLETDPSYKKKWSDGLEDRLRKYM